MAVDQLLKLKIAHSAWTGQGRCIWQRENVFYEKLSHDKVTPFSPQPKSFEAVQWAGNPGLAAAELFVERFAGFTAQCGRFLNE